MPDDLLRLEASEMREAGYRVVDALVDWLHDESAPLLRRATPHELEELLGGPPPEEPERFDGLLDRLFTDVLSFASRGHHPGFLAFVPSCGTWPGALGDFVASACNVYAGSWMESPGPSQLELEVLGWFKDWVGYPAGAAGILVSGGSAANLTALACARETLAGPMSGDLVLYVSDQAHSSLARAARHLGFRPEQVRVLPVDRRYRLRPERLASAIEVDLEAGRRPLFVSASGGATNTGAVDPLAELADVCREYGVWLHADAAYGGFAVLTERGRAALAALAEADSITLDPHKWLYQPFECGCVLVRRGDALRRAFEIVPDYLQDTEAHAGEVNFADLGMQLTRQSRALKVWLSIRTFGLAAFRAAIDRSLDLAELAATHVETSDALELAAPPSLSVVCLRRRLPGATDPEQDAVNERLVAAVEESGLGLVSSTWLDGRYAIRLCILNHTTTAEDVVAVLDFLASADVAQLPGGRALEQRSPDIGRTWLRSRGPTPEELRRLPLFESLDDGEAAFAAGLATEREALPGETIVAQWDIARDFFAVVAGWVEVRIDGKVVNELGPGDFFGELAALDWGAGFGYSRVASVVATTPLRLVVFPAGGLNELVRSLPTVASQIRHAVRERLPRTPA